MKKQINKKVIGGVGAGIGLVGGAIYLLTKFLGKPNDDEILEIDAEDVIEETDFEEESE